RGVTQDASVDTCISPAYTRADIPVRTVSVSERRSPMSAPHTDGWTRRRFLGGLTVAGTAGLLGLRARPVAAEPPPETTPVRIGNWDAGFICVAPQWVAQELLRLEGFTDIRNVDFTKADARRAEAANTQPGAEMSSRGEADFTLINTVQLPPTLEAGVPITV